MTGRFLILAQLIYSTVDQFKIGLRKISSQSNVLNKRRATDKSTIFPALQIQIS